MGLDIVVLWVFILSAGVRGELIPTQIVQATSQEACEDIRSAHLQKAVSPRCYQVYVMQVK